VYSLNAPVPASVARLASGLAADLLDATVRERHTLVVKRLGADGPGKLADAVREVVEGTEPFAARATAVEVFRDPPTGPAPVAYLRVASPGLERLHRRLCERFDAVEEIEGDEYVPHVTVARGGDAHRLEGRGVDAGWTVDRLHVRTGTSDEPMESIALP
jgi:hypothetical protein